MFLWDGGNLQCTHTFLRGTAYVDSAVLVCNVQRFRMGKRVRPSVPSPQLTLYTAERHGGLQESMPFY